MLNGLLQDVRYALRVFTSARGFSVGVIGSLTLGIAVNAIAFAMINAMFLRALPGIESPRRVVRIELCRWTEHSSCRWESSSYDDYRVMRGSLRSLSDLSARVLGQVAARIRGEAVTLRAAFVSPNYFDVLGARLPLGRAFVATEENGPVAIISHGLWRRHFLEDRSILGEYVDVGTISVRIVGVAPEDFLGAAVAGDGRDVWIPFGMMSGAVSPMRTSPFGVSRPAGHHQIDYIGRLGPDATLESADAEANVFVGSLSSRRLDPRARYRRACPPVRHARLDDGLSARGGRDHHAAAARGPSASPASTRRVCCWRARPTACVRRPCGWRWAPHGGASCVTCSSKAPCWRLWQPCLRLSSRSGPSVCSSRYADVDSARLACARVHGDARWRGGRAVRFRPGPAQLVGERSRSDRRGSATRASWRRGCVMRWCSCRSRPRAVGHLSVCCRG